MQTTKHKDLTRSFTFTREEQAYIFALVRAGRRVLLDRGDAQCNGFALDLLGALDGSRVRHDPVPKRLEIDEDRLGFGAERSEP